MNAREFKDTYNKLRFILGINDELVFNEGLAEQLESAVFTKKELFDTHTIESVQKSYANGRYTIRACDSDLIKCIKAFINLLRSLSVIENKNLLGKLEQLLKSQGSVSTAINTIAIAPTAVKSSSELNQIIDDFFALYFHAQQFSTIVQNLNDLSQQMQDRLKETIAALKQTEVGQGIISAQQYRAKENEKALSAHVVRVNTNIIENVIAKFGIYNDATAVLELTNSMLDAQHEHFSIRQQRYTVTPDIDQATQNLMHAYNSSRNLDELLQEAQVTLQAVMLHQKSGILEKRWNELDVSIRNDYTKLAELLANIQTAITQLEETGTQVPALAKILKRSQHQRQRQQAELNRILNSNQYAAVNALNQSINAEGILKITAHVADSNLTEIDKHAYFDAGIGLYDTKLAASKHELCNKINLMHIANMTSLAHSALISVYDLQANIGLGKLPEAIDLIKMIGRIKQELEAINIESLDSFSRDLLGENIDIILSNLARATSDITTTARETEIRLGLKDYCLVKHLDILGKKVDDTFKHIDTHLRESGIKIKAELNTEKLIADAVRQTEINNSNALHSRSVKLIHVCKELEKFSGQLNPDNPNKLITAIQIHAHIKQLSSYKAALYQESLESLINHLVGLDRLEESIRDEKNRILNNISPHRKLGDGLILNNNIEDRLNELPEGALTDELKQLHFLYIKRAELLDMLDDLRTGIKNGVAPAHLPKVFRFTKHSEIGRLYNFYNWIGKYHLSEGEKTNLKGIDFKVLADMHQATTNMANETIININEKLVTLPQVENGGDTQPQENIDAEQAATETHIQRLSHELKLSDNEFILNMIAAEKGSLILQAESARATLMQYLEKALDSTELQHVKEHTSATNVYTLVADEKLLTSTSKYICNSIQAFNALIDNSNDLQTILNQGMLNYTEALKLLRPAIDNTNNLIHNLSMVNLSLELVRDHIGGELYATLKEHLSKTFAVLQDIPSYLSGLSNDKIGLLAPFIGADNAEQIKQLSRQLKELVANSKEVKVINDTHGKIKQENATIIADLKRLIKPDTYTVKEDGSIDLSNLPTESGERCIAGLINVAHAMNRTLCAAEAMADGRNISGLIGVVKNLLQARATLRNANINEVTGNTYKQFRSTYDEIHKNINQQIGYVLKVIQPLIRDTYARTSLAENILGINPGLLIDKLDSTLETLIEFSHDYPNSQFDKLDTERPYHQEQIKIVAEKIQSLQARIEHANEQQTWLIRKEITQLNEIANTIKLQLATAEHNAIELDDIEIAEQQPDDEFAPLLDEHTYAFNADAKINKLNQACIDYKHHLATSINNLLEKNRPGQRFRIDQDTPMSFQEAHNDPILTLSICKYNAVTAMQNTLKGDKHESQTKLANFSLCFRQHRKLLEKRRDTAGITFLKVLATVFSFGIAAACGLWKPYGKKVNKAIDQAFENQQRLQVR